MRNILAVLFALIFVSIGAIAENQCAYSKDQVTGGGGIPWPFSKEVNFSWTKLQGTWATSSDDCQTLFYFNVSPISESGQRFISVQQINPITCQTTAQGTGQVIGRVAHALMFSGARKYELTIRAFSEEDVRTAGGYDVDPKNVKFRVVLSLYPRENWNKQVSYEVERIQPGKEVACRSFVAKP